MAYLGDMLSLWSDQEQNLKGTGLSLLVYREPVTINYNLCGHLENLSQGSIMISNLPFLSSMEKNT